MTMSVSVSALTLSQSGQGLIWTINLVWGRLDILVFAAECIGLAQVKRVSFNLAPGSQYIGRQRSQI